MVADGLWNGGAERQMALLASSLPEGWSSAVASLQDGPYRPVLEGLGVDVQLAPRRFRLDATAALRMWRIATKTAPDVVHSWGWMSTLAMVPYCRTYGIPLLVGTIRQGCLPRRRAVIDKLAVRLADAVVANSRAGLAAYGVAEGDRGRVVYNGFDHRRLEGLAVAGDARPGLGTTVVMAARMFPEKDWRTLIAAARVLAREAEGWRFVALGSGPDRAALMAEAIDLVEAGVVSFPEGGLEVLPVIAGADVGVLLTSAGMAAEGCSNAIMEYMACALPVVCTASGGNPELVEDGVTGAFVPAGDSGALVEVLRSLRDEPEIAHAMGAAGLRRLQRGFSVQSMVAGFVSAYEAATTARGRRT